MNITPYGANGLVFRVDSETRNYITHVVDIGDETCTCEHWICNLSKQPAGTPKAKRRCKHIKAVRDWYLDNVITAVRTMEMEKRA